MHSIQPTWWDVEKVIQSNPGLFPVKTYGFFIGDKIYLVEVSHINKSGILGVETDLVENSRSPSYPFLR